MRKAALINLAIGAVDILIASVVTNPTMAAVLYIFGGGMIGAGAATLIFCQPIVITHGQLWRALRLCAEENNRLRADLAKGNSDVGVDRPHAAQ